MNFTQPKFMLNSTSLEDGEYYVFTQQEGGKIRLGYIYTTWCGEPCGMYMSFSVINIGKPLSLFISGNSKDDKGQLKIFNFDSRNRLLINDVYQRAKIWLKKMQGELKHPQLDESAGCKIEIIQVKQGILCNLYDKDSFLKITKLHD